MTTPKVISQDTEEPISIEECRAHLEALPYGGDVDALDDVMIMGWLAAAREKCEDFLGLSLTPRILEIALDGFPRNGCAILLPMGPVREILSVTGGTGSDAELDPASYTLDTHARPNRIVAATWPTLTRSTNAVIVRYYAGFGIDSDGGEPLPDRARAAMLLILGDLFRNREDSVEKPLTEIPNSARSLMRGLRVRLGMA